MAFAPSAAVVGKVGTCILQHMCSGTAAVTSEAPLGWHEHKKGVLIFSMQLHHSSAATSTQVLEMVVIVKNLSVDGMPGVGSPVPIIIFTTSLCTVVEGHDMCTGAGSCMMVVMQWPLWTDTQRMPIRDGQGCAILYYAFSCQDHHHGLPWSRGLRPALSQSQTDDWSCVTLAEVKAQQF